jgi:cytochrome P450
MGELLGQCVGLISHNNWKNLRSITEAPFIHREMAHNIGYIEGRTRKHIEFLQSRSKLSEGVLNPVEDLKILPFRLVAHIIYGDLTTDMEARLERMIDVRESIFQGVISGGITRFWWYKYLPTSMNRDLAHFKEEWSDFNNMARQQAVSVPISRFYQNVELGTITLIQMLQTVDEILFANLDVTMGGISWVLMFLASNPDVQGDLRKEIMANLSGTQDTHAYLLRSTTFLHATIMEASRLKPLAPFTIPQSAPTDRHVGGFVIPAGTNFIVDSYALNTHNPYWGKDSKTYRPARWLERNVTKSRYNFWRFGFGPRGCMGKHTADLIIRVLLVQLLKDYELFLIDEQTTWVKNDVTWITHPDTVLGCQRIST